MRTQELVEALYKVGVLSVAEYVERINPGTRLGSRFSVVRVAGILERNVDEEVGDAELFEARHV